MQIHGPAHVHGPHPINPPHKVQPPQSAPQSSGVQGADELNISEAAQAISKARDVPSIRQDRVAEIRAQIAEGVYETEEKLDIAVERLLDEIG